MRRSWRNPGSTGDFGTGKFSSSTANIAALRVAGCYSNIPGNVRVTGEETRKQPPLIKPTVFVFRPL